MLPQPFALARRPQEPAVALGCILALGLVFVTDAVTPIQIAVSALGLIPLLTAMWLLRLPLALAVGGIAVAQLLATGILGTLNPVTVAAELTAYVVLAVVCRLYAAGLADLIPAATHPGRTGSRRGRHPAITLAGTGPKATLTKRERQIAILAAEGYTAREIGMQLHIGKRTVETHLANAYDKLGVRSKRDLIQSAALSRTNATTDHEPRPAR